MLILKVLTDISVITDVTGTANVYVFVCFVYLIIFLNINIIKLLLLCLPKHP